VRFETDHRLVARDEIRRRQIENRRGHDEPLL
jgi:hypothetical protein